MDRGGVGTKLHHALHDPANDAVTSTDPPGVDRRDDAGVLIREQEGDAVGSQDDQRDVSQRCDESVGGWHGPRPQHVRGDLRNRRGVQLLHEHEAFSVEPQDLGEPSAVGGDRRRVVPDVISQVKAAVGSLGHAAVAGGEHHPDGALGRACRDHRF